MARALAYVLQFESEVYQHNHLIEIWEEGFIGTPTNLRMGISGMISKRERDGGIYGTSMELKLESTLDSQLIKLYTSDSKKFLVKHYRNNVLVQSGLIVPEQYSEEYIAAPYDIVVTATDGLGLLKEQNYNYFGRHTVLEVLKYCLDSTGVILDFDLICELTESGADPARSILAQRTIDGEHWRGRTIYDVLTELSATFRAFITQHNGRWRFARYSDLQSQSMIYTNALTYLISLPNNSLVLGNLNNDIYPIGALNFAIDPAFKSVKFTRTYAKRASFFSNPEFKMLDQWDVESMASTRVFRDKNYVILRSLYAGEQISQTIPVEQSERVFNFNISYFRISYTPTVFYVKFKLVGTNGQTYWLGKEGWQSTESSFSMEANEISDVESIYPTSTDLRSRQTLQQTGSVQWVGIPSAGALTLIILAKGPASVGTDESRRSQFAITDALLTTEVEKGLTVDALLSTGNLSAPDTEIFFGDADVGDNPANILTNFFLRPDGSKSSLWKVGAAGAEDSFFNTMVKDYVVWYGLPKRLLTGEVMGNNLQTAMCLLDKFGDTFMYIDTMILDVFADQAEIEAREIIPHMNVMAVNEEVEDPTMPNVTIWYETLPDGTVVKRYTVHSSGSTYRRSTTPGSADLTLEEILRAQSLANFSTALAALAQRKSDEANLAALAAAESADDALLRLNNIASNSIVSIEEKAGLVQLIDRLSDEILLYKADSANKGASVEELEASFDALLDFLTITVEIMNSAAATELTAEEITQYSALFADFYAKKSVFTTDVSSIRAELISFKNRIDSIDQDKAKVLAEHAALINTAGSTEAAKTALTTKKDEYITAHTAYKTALSSAIIDDKITDVERTAANDLFETYSTKLDSFNIAAEAMRKSVTDAINTTLSAWVADGVISPLEKLAIRQTRAQVLSEKESLIADAGVYDIATAAYLTAWTAYDTALAKYSAEEPEIITVDTDFASSESAYKSAKVALKTAITNAQKSDTGEKHPKGGSADLDMTVKNLVAVGYVGFYGGVSGGSTPASSLLDLSDIDATTASAVVGSPLVKLGNGKWGPGSVSIDLTNYFTKEESDARFAFKAHSHDYVAPTAFNAHTGDTTKHITSAERVAWNSKEPALGNPDVDGKILASTAGGVRSWVNRYVLPIAAAAMLGGVMIGENVNVDAQGRISVAAPYSHPATHPASMIDESATRRFLTDAERANWNDSYDKRHTHGNKANLDSINQNLSQTSDVKFNDMIADGSVGFYGGVGSGSTPVASLLDLSDIDASISTAATGTPLVKLANGKWGAGSVSIDLSNYYNKSDADARYAFKSHSHDYVTTGVFNGHTHTWASITGKPASFTPSAHTHLKAEITDFPTTWAWASLTGVPTTFAPSAHSHAITDITNLQTTLNGKEAGLGNPSVTGYLLSSTIAGVRSWVAPYAHPVTSGNKHIPSGGSTGQILKWSADGTAVWAVEYSYTHPATHPASMIDESATRRFLTDAERANWNDSYDKRHTHGNKANLDSINQNLSQTSNVKFNDVIADGSVGFYGGVGSGSTPVASLLDLSDIDASISAAATGTPLVKLANGKWGAGSISIDLSNYYNKSDADARYAFKSHSHDYVTTGVFNGHTHTWASITGKPASFTPSAHTHAWSEIVSGKPTTLSGYGITSNDTLFDGKYIFALSAINSNATKTFPAKVGITLYANYGGSTNFPTAYGATVDFSFVGGNNASTWERDFSLWKQSASEKWYLRGYSGTDGTPLSWKEIWHSGNLLNIGTTASTARAALGLGSMALETASNYLTTATAASTYLPLSGGTLTLDGVISKKAYVGGDWARQILRFENSTASIRAVLGAFGASDSISYMYLGFNAFDANNLRVYSDKVQFGNSLIYHSGNSNSSSVAWAASTFTEGGVLLSNKYLGISAKAANSDLFDGIDSSYFIYGNVISKTRNDFTDFNSLWQAGFYAKYNASNAAQAGDFVAILMPYFGATSTNRYSVRIGGWNEVYHQLATEDGSGTWYKIWSAANSNSTTKDWSAKNLALAGTLSGVTTLSASGIVTLSNTTQSTAYSNGALVLAGGLGIAKDLISNGKAFFASYVESASYLKGTSVKLGTWEIKENASGELEFIQSGVLKFKGTSAGLISQGELGFYS